jgi:hypothetical protein
VHKAASYLFVLILFFFGGNNAFCQEYPMLRYTFEDGLPSNTVYQVYRDSKGFLWIATDKGIARYNGIKFEIFTSFDGLPDNEVYFFKEDPFGRLWLGTANGKLCFYKDGIFHNQENTPYLKLPFKKSHITCISVEYDSSVTINFYDPNILVNIYKDKLKPYDFQRLQNASFIGIFHKRKIAKDKYMMYGHRADAIIDTLLNIRLVNDHLPNEHMILSISQDQRYIVDSHFVYSVDRKAIWPLTNGFFNNNSIRAVYTDKINFFFVTKNGLFINDTSVVIRGDISSITQDGLGNYWVGSLTSGIFCLRNDFLTTRIYSNVYTDNIRYCKSLQNHMFYATGANDLYILEYGKPRKIFDYGNYIHSNYIQPNDAAYLIDSDYTFYSFYNRDHLVVKNILKETPVIYRYKNPFTVIGVKAVYRDVADIYLRTRTNLIILDHKETSYGMPVKNIYITDSNSQDRISSVARGKDNKLWYSTLENNMFKVVNGERRHQGQFKDIALKSFDFLGEYMAGYTFDNKLLLIHNQDGPIKVDSFPAPNCVWNRLYKLNDSMMLISTNNFHRLLKVHANNKEKPTLSVVEDPFVPLNIEAFCSDDSTCYFFKNGSVTTMSIQSLLRRNSPPKLYFSSLRTTKETSSITGEMEIPYRESRNLTISFASQSFAGKDVSYEYLISGNGEDSWRAVKGEEINLVNSGYGDHAIMVRAKTLNSGYCEPIMFRLHILRPYWATWWFISICVVAGIILVGAIISYRMMRALRRKEKLHESEVKFLKLEYKALNALMNPHFIFNALNNMQGLINKNEKLAANRYLTIFANLVRRNMHNISLELISLDKEMEVVADYLKLEKLRFKDHLNYAINIASNVDVTDIMVPPLLIQPLVENAIRHGIFPSKSEDSFVGIDIYEQGNLLIIAVKDNGIGIEAAKKKVGKTHQSYGLENIRKRIAQFGIIQNKKITLHLGETKDDTGKLQWTVATISISLS